MLKKRVIPVLLLDDDKVVKGKQFKDYRVTGLASTSVKTFSASDADEIAFINIGKTDSSIENLIQTISLASRECLVPLLVGGSVQTLDHIHSLFAAGADKVLITSAAYRQPDLIKKAVSIYGSQSVVAGIDYLESYGNLVSIDHGKTPLQVDIVTYSSYLEDLGVGEIFLNSIERDGMMKGLDLELPQLLYHKISLPLIVCGGAGHVKHLRDLFITTNVSAVACSSLFHFGDNNNIRIRSYLRNQGIAMRRLK